MYTAKYLLYTVVQKKHGAKDGRAMQKFGNVLF